MTNKEDWLRVILVKESNKPEAVPVAFLENMGEYSIGILGIEPNQDFGYHRGDKIVFFPYTAESGNTILISDMNSIRRLTVEDLESGELLKEAIAVFNRERNEANFFDVLGLLRDSYVWIPCNAVLSENDQRRMDKMMDGLGDNLECVKGMKFIAHDETRLIPDILQNGEDFFFPVFSSVEEMGEYGDNFSKIEKHFLEALPLAINNDRELAGIVVNAFSESFILDKELWDIVANMKSRLSE